MPNEKKFPTGYDKYVVLKKRTQRTDALQAINRFVYRYRLAASFEGMNAPDVGKTLLGYDVLTKLFLSYTAYEALLRVTKILRVRGVKAPAYNVVCDKSLAKRLRANDKLREFLLSYPNESLLANKLHHFFRGSFDDIVCVAYALRNVFAHGDLTASHVGTETIAKRKLFTDLANHLLDYCDEVFKLCLYEL